MVKAAGAPVTQRADVATTRTPRELVRERLARTIDATAERVARPRILSLGCGRLREMSLSMAFAQLRIGTLAVLDPDRSALAQMALEHGNVPGLVLIGGTVRDLLTGAVAPTGYDLIYTVGLYDQLPRPVATALTAVLVKALNPSGELVVGKLGSTEAELRGLLSIVPRDEITSVVTSIDEIGGAAYLELVKT